jgi:hypothetical protein
MYYVDNGKIHTPNGTQMTGKMILNHLNNMYNALDQCAQATEILYNIFAPDVPEVVPDEVEVSEDTGVDEVENAGD